jgi:membrane peptidoglycan carboxypeptidase
MFFEKAPQFSALTLTLGRRWVQPGDSPLMPHAYMAGIAEALDHREIVKYHVQTVFLGLGCYGASAASEAYFGRPPEALELHEAAFLAALPKAPARFHPQRAPERALERRNFVLAEMARPGVATKAEAEAASAKPLGVRDPLAGCVPPAQKAPE